MIYPTIIDPIKVPV